MTPQEVEIDGEMWFPFSVEFAANANNYEIYIFAKSPEHAQEMLDALKSTGRIGGQIVEYIDADEDIDALMSADRVLN